MTTQDEQAREDWEGLSESMMGVLEFAGDTKVGDLYLWAHLATRRALHRRWLLDASHRLTPRGQRCAAYGRKVTGG